MINDVSCIIISCVSASGYIRLVSDEKNFHYAKRMFLLFRDIVKLCSTNRLFT